MSKLPHWLGSGLVSEGLDSGLSRSRVTGSGTISLTLRDACTCAVSCRLVAHEFQSLMSRQVINPTSVQTGECAALEATSQEQSISVLHLWKKHWSLSVFWAAGSFRFGYGWKWLTPMVQHTNANFDPSCESMGSPVLNHIDMWISSIRWNPEIPWAHLGASRPWIQRTKSRQ